MFSRLCAFRRFGDVCAQLLSASDQVLQDLVVDAAIFEPQVFDQFRCSLYPVADHMDVPCVAFCAFDVTHPHQFEAFFPVLLPQSVVEVPEDLLRFLHIRGPFVFCKCQRPDKVAFIEVGVDHPLRVLFASTLILFPYRRRRRLRLRLPLLPWRSVLRRMVLDHIDDVGIPVFLLFIHL